MSVRAVGSIAGTAMFDDCVSADDCGQASARRVKESTVNMLAGREKASDDTATVAYFSLVLARTLPENSLCFIGIKSAECEKDLDLVMKNPRSKEAAMGAYNDMKAKEVDIRKPRES